MTGRRHFIAGASLAACLAPFTALAQRAPLPRIALLSNNTPVAESSGPDPVDPNARAFVHGLRDLGWVEGRNIAIERRSAEGHPERIPAMVQEVVALGVDVLVAYGPRLSLAAKQATQTIPIVSIGVSNPVAQGLVSSLARPGGNVTGLSMDAGAALNGKRLQLLKEMVPAATRVAVIRPSPRAGRPTWSAETDTAARALGLNLSIAAVDAPEDLDTAFATIARERPDALWCGQMPITLGNRGRIIDFAARQRLPVVYDVRFFVEAGGLMSYGAELNDLSRRAASYVDRLLKGAKPAELPVEQPTRFYLVINLKTAKALGLTIPYSLRVFADEVIE